MSSIQEFQNRNLHPDWIRIPKFKFVLSVITRYHIRPHRCYRTEGNIVGDSFRRIHDFPAIMIHQKLLADIRNFLEIFSDQAFKVLSRDLLEYVFGYLIVSVR
jgi:hypothetical protein